MRNACQYCMEEFPKAETVAKHEETCRWKDRKLDRIWIIRKQTCKVVEKKAHIAEGFGGILSATTVNEATYVGDGVEFFTDHGEAVIAAGIQKANALDELNTQARDLETQMGNLKRKMASINSQKARLVG